MKTKLKPHVAMTYSHQYGVDVNFYASMKAAYKAACNIIVSYWDEIGSLETQTTIRNFIHQKKWLKAISEWEQNNGNEYFQFNQIKEVYGFNDICDPKVPEEETDENEDEIKAERPFDF